MKWLISSAESVNQPASIGIAFPHLQSVTAVTDDVRAFFSCDC
ncbi:hypothetical protein SynBIOSE41_01218 [Synechococcus sp. BIOS-E4-1]|nr:hypothetical protein SynBIOSE41_01218 [Synechococcus sp. BIOS-E4-1]